MGKSNDNTNTKDGKYIYCIIKHDCPIEFGPIGIGGRGDLVYGVFHKDVCAVISTSLEKEYRARRANISAHQKVLEEVMKQFTILPVRFSTISESGEDSRIQRLLEKDYGKFSDLLKEMEGKKELGVKALAREGVIFKHILEKHSNIRSLKEKIAQLPAAKTHSHRVKIGELVGAALKDENELFKSHILNALNPLSADVKINDNYGDRMIINAAFLVDERRENEFDQEVDLLDDKYGGLIELKYLGSLPPYNFVNLEINTEDL